MKSLFRFAVALLAFISLPVISGPQYILAPTPQPVKTAKVEVVEFFWYGCNHCYDLEPKLAAWVRGRSDIVFKRVHAPMNPDWVSMTQTFYALTQMKKLDDTMHNKIFDAIHKEGYPLYDDNTVLFNWIGQQGIDKEKFKAAFNSFGVQVKVGQARQLCAIYKLTGVPAIVVDGTYITSPKYAGDKVLQVLDELVEKAKADRQKKR